MGLQLLNFGQATASASLVPGDVFVAHLYREIALCIMCEPIGGHSHFMILGGENPTDAVPSMVSAESLPTTVATIDEPIFIRPLLDQKPYLVADTSDAQNGNLVTSPGRPPAILVITRGLGRHLVQLDGTFAQRSPEEISYPQWAAVVQRGDAEIELVRHVRTPQE